MTPLEACVKAQTAPVEALRAVHGMLTDAIIAATTEFDEYAAAELTRAAGVVCGIAAEAMRQHATSAVYARRRKRMIGKAAARPDPSAVPGSEAWEQI